jgi:hypothetical protein
MRRVAQEHIDAALTAVFGDSKQIAGREASDEAQEGKHLQLLSSVLQSAAGATRHALRAHQPHISKGSVALNLLDAQTPNITRKQVVMCACS